MKYLDRLLFTTLLLLVAAGCSAPNGDTQETEPSDLAGMEQSGIIEYTTANLQPITEQIALSGHVVCDPEHMAVVFTPMGGSVLAVYANEGGYVRRGDKLARLSSAQMAEIQRQLTDAKLRIDIEQRNVETAQELSAAGVMSGRDLVQARRQLADAKGEKARLDAMMSYCHPRDNGVFDLVAPQSGYVIDKRVSTGILLPEGYNDTLFVISNTKKVWVMADVYENQIGRIEPNQLAKVMLLAYPDTAFEGTVDCLYQFVDNSRKTIQARIVLDNQSGLLKPGMFVTANIVLSQTQQTFPCIPSSAIIFDGGKNYVVVKKGDYAEIATITTAVQHEGLCYVADGIESGQQVVSRNPLLIYNKLRRDNTQK